MILITTLPWFVLDYTQSRRGEVTGTYFKPNKDQGQRSWRTFSHEVCSKNFFNRWQWRQKVSIIRFPSLCFKTSQQLRVNITESRMGLFQREEVHFASLSTSFQFMTTYKQLLVHVKSSSKIILKDNSINTWWRFHHSYILFALFSVFLVFWKLNLLLYSAWKLRTHLKKHKITKNDSINRTNDWIVK